MNVILFAWAIRPDLLGVTSLVRASFLEGSCYPLLLHFFHSRSLMLGKITERWVKLALRLFQPVDVGGRILFVADGLKIPKEGKKMPGVKSLHQESVDNSKAEFIMGHSLQAISLLVAAGTAQVFAIPLISRICEGFRPRKAKDRKSLLDKLVEMFLDIVRIAGCDAVLVADAYYASRKVILPLLGMNQHLVTRVRNNSVAYQCAPKLKVKRKGRPKKYGQKHRLLNFFKGAKAFSEGLSPVYGEDKVTIRYRYVDLIWRPVGRVVRFVFVKHPTRGSIILLSTDLSMDALTVIRIYGYRFKIEVSFKHAIHRIGAYAYHFWMRSMKPTKRGDGDKCIEQMSPKYQRNVARKIGAYHAYIQLACVLQGLLLHLAINFRIQVWVTFNGWLRTMKPDLVPSELVVMKALESRFFDFLSSTSIDPKLKKFILERIAPERAPGFNLAA